MSLILRSNAFGFLLFFRDQSVGPSPKVDKTLLTSRFPGSAGGVPDPLDLDIRIFFALCSFTKERHLVHSHFCEHKDTKFHLNFQADKRRGSITLA